MHKIPQLANDICQLQNIEISFHANGPKKTIYSADDHIPLTLEQTDRINYADKSDLAAAIELIKTTRYSLNRENKNASQIVRRYRKIHKNFATELEAWYHAINPPI